MVDARSDLYSAGCLLFELVTGRPPFVADSPVAVAYQHVREPPPRPSSLNPAIPEDLDHVILHSLAKDREARYQTAAEFRADVDNVRTGHRVTAPAPSAESIRDGFDAASGAPTEYLGNVAATRSTPETASYATSMLPTQADATQEVERARTDTSSNAPTPRPRGYGVSVT
jgi:serine/threonine-protein kinase